MKKVKFMGMLLIPIVAMTALFGCSKKDTEPSKAAFVQIDFPEYGGELNPHIEVKNEMDDSEIENADFLNSAFLSSYKITENEKDRLVKIFEMQDSNVNFEDGTYKYKKDENGKDVRLEIYENGTFFYKSGLIGEEEIEMLISEEEAIQKAQKFLEEKGLLPDKFSYGGVSSYKLTKEESTEEIEIAKTIHFFRYIDDKQIYGDSQIYVTLSYNGEVTEVYSSYLKAANETIIGDNSIIDIKDKLNSKENLNALVSAENFLDIDEEADTLVVTNIKVTYWEESSPYTDENYIQPVYEITGKQYEGDKDLGNFTIISQALSTN